MSTEIREVYEPRYRDLSKEQRRWLKDELNSYARDLVRIVTHADFPGGRS